MTKSEYLAQLAHKLRVLPEGEMHDALEYYDGYISDSENESLAIMQLGSPGEVAANILANYVSRDGNSFNAAAKSKDKKGFKTAWGIILAIFAVPIGLPLVIALFAAAFSLFVALSAVIFSVAVAAISLIGAGGVSVVASVFVMLSDFGFGMLTLGSGMAAMGLGILLLVSLKFLMRGFTWISKFVGKKITRKNKKEVLPV